MSFLEARDKALIGKILEAELHGHELLPEDAEADAAGHLPESQPGAIQLLSEEVARRYNVIPLAVSGRTLQVAMANLSDILALEAVAAQTRMKIKPVAAGIKEIQEAIDLNYRTLGGFENELCQILAPVVEVTAEEATVDTSISAPVSRSLQLIIDEAAKARASDIHIEPQEDRLRVRCRIDGTLHEVLSLPLAVSAPLVSRVKILSDMNIADHHRPQDGQFSVKTKGRLIDIRVGTTDTVYGEMAVLRLLDKSLAVLSLSELGFLPDSLAKYENMLKVPYGMILVSGPTGAGKTTTLYASVNCLDRVGRNIITIEDPVEYRFKDINQIQVNPKAGLTFGSGLRSILRLDPDVILVGEIRDAETANIAIQSALTGHLVLSSIHANDAVNVVFRLLDLGVEPFLVSSAVIGVVAQRMVRRVCSHCSCPAKASAAEQAAYRQEVGEERDEFLCGAGCRTCADTGYLGRVGIFEVLSMSDEIRGMLLSSGTATQIRTQAIKEGMVTLMKDGMLKVKAGITTPSEVLRNAYSSS